MYNYEAPKMKIEKFAQESIVMISTIQKLPQSLNYGDAGNENVTWSSLIEFKEIK